MDRISPEDFKSLARSISLVENEVPGYEDILHSLDENNGTVIGITGPPGAGKSTITDALIGHLVNKGKVAVLCVDPSSPFNYGSLLGDRIRMSEWYNHPDVFIRSLASRGSLGGLHPKIIEITGLMRSAGFDFVIVETIGVGQSEVEIAGLADVTIVVLVPESGDTIQTMKAGVMEIADIFVVNKSDRPGAETFVQNLKMMLGSRIHDIPIIQTIASEKKGIDKLCDAILEVKKNDPEKKFALLAEKAWQMIQRKKMRHVSRDELLKRFKEQPGLSVFKLVEEY